jgi:hypothetical protein
MIASFHIGDVGTPRGLRVLRTNARAAALAASDPARLASSTFLRPPRLVGTSSVWRTTAEMRAFATGRTGPAHRDAIRADRCEGVHPRADAHPQSGHTTPSGAWNGLNPLADAAVPAAA